MAINYPNFLNAPSAESPWKNAFENVLKGYQMEQEPQKMADEQKKTELANALQSKALEHYEEKFKLDKDYKNAQIDNLQRGGGKGAPKLTGDIGNYKLTHPDATDDDIRKFADRYLESKINHTDAGTTRANVLSSTQNERDQTQQGKLLAEAKDVDDGFIPGTGRTQKFDTPQQQQFYKDQYALKLLQQRSDSVTRNRSIYAGLVDNTFDSINVDKLVQFSGIEGTIDKYAAKHQLVPEEDMVKYREYKEEQAKVQVLAKQIRQFYGDSISPGNLKKLEEISNPATWSESPAAAKAQFEAFKKIVKQETGIYRTALSNITPFQAPQTGSSSGSFDFSKYPVAGGG
jgi:hypothetical protein